VEAASTADDSAGALASAALSKYQAQLAGPSKPQLPRPPPTTAITTPAIRLVPVLVLVQVLRQLQRKQQTGGTCSKKNQLSADDRFRVQQFFRSFQPNTSRTDL
jgi:hypothetical protein